MKQIKNIINALEYKLRLYTRTNPDNMEFEEHIGFLRGLEMAMSLIEKMTIDDLNKE